MLLALTWPTAFVAVAAIFATMMVFFMIFGLPMMSRSSQPIGLKKLNEIADDMAAIRTDVAELKEAVAELDRQFRSVG